MCWFLGDSQNVLVLYPPLQHSILLLEEKYNDIISVFFSKSPVYSELIFYVSKISITCTSCAWYVSFRICLESIEIGQVPSYTIHDRTQFFMFIFSIWIAFLQKGLILLFHSREEPLEHTGAYESETSFQDEQSLAKLGFWLHGGSSSDNSLHVK